MCEKNEIRCDEPEASQEKKPKKRKQLMMIVFPKPLLPIGLPEGYQVTNYTGKEEEQDAWLEVCKYGLTSENDTRAKFKREILDWGGIKPLEDLFFIEHEGRKVATITAVDRVENGMGYVHMVAVKPEYRGKGLGNCLIRIALNKLAQNQCRMAYLTTSEERRAACKSYLSAGFYPVNHGEDMPGRWSALLSELGIESVRMLTENGEPDILIYADGQKAPDLLV